jgi:hypothetical protein
VDLDAKPRIVEGNFTVVVVAGPERGRPLDSSVL